MDLSELRDQGVQVIRGFFPADIREDLRRRAQEVLDLRLAGKLSTDSQDAMGLPDDWFLPVLRDQRLVDLAVQVYGPDVCGSGWRVLMKDRFFQSGVKVHQDYAYNQGDSKKLNVFVPLTRVNEDNGGLFFYKESHLYGPVLRGAIDPSRVEPMEAVCPDVDVGDLVIADFLTWHSSGVTKNDEPRVMLQLVYQPASDPSSNEVVAGKSTAKRLLLHKSDAMGLLESQLNGTEARGYFASGDLDRARRWALGLLTDDPQHAGAALLMAKILAQSNDAGALRYLEQARKALRQLQGELDELDVRFGLKADAGGREPPAAAADRPDGGRWRALEAAWQQNNAGPIESDSLPVTLSTPPAPWDYGATTRNLITVDTPAAIRIRAQAQGGKIGVCLLSEDYGELRSDVHVLGAGGDDGEETIMLAVDPTACPVRLLVRNEGDEGRAGRLVVSSIDILEVAAG